VAGFQDVADNIAYVIGGTVDPNNARRFSGNDFGGVWTGVAGIKYAYSAYPDTIQDLPMAIVLPRVFSVTREPLTQGQEDNLDDFRALVLCSRQSPVDIWPTLIGFRDSVPTAFRSHMQLFGTANVLQAYVKSGRVGAIRWAGDDYLGVDFVVRVLRVLGVSYTA